MSSHFRFLHICRNWQFTSVVGDIASAEEENAAAAAAAKKEEELQQTDLERHMEAAAANLKIWMEAAAEVDEIAEKGMKEAAKEAKIKAAVAKATTFLSFLVGVRTDRCAIF